MDVIWVTKTNKSASRYTLLFEPILHAHSCQSLPSGLLRRFVGDAYQLHDAYQLPLADNGGCVALLDMIIKDARAMER
eukprot:scaffold192891_cov13-Prasinocladus_malaysianus.AAC.1